MALTPEDVVNKRFQPTKFREGYDQDEVDDFLDEVVVELRRLNQENEELRQRLIASDSRINELQRGAVQPAPTGFEQPVAAPAPFQPAAPAPGAIDQAGDPGNTNNLLQLARRLHEEHVREGVEKRDALIAEGQAQAARMVEDGRQQAARAIEEAQMQTRNQLSALDQERSSLEQRVEELRNFEREYRAKLKGYIEGQLRELESSSAALPTAGASDQTPVSSAQTPVPVGQGAVAAAPVPQGVVGQGYAAQQIAAPPVNYPDFAGN